jgi:hypothetical protein
MPSSRHWINTLKVSKNSLFAEEIKPFTENFMWTVLLLVPYFTDKVPLLENNPGL